MKVVYGTSDKFLNFGEVTLVWWVAEELGGSPHFFNYPKGPEWDLWETALFEPYDLLLEEDFEEVLKQAGLPPIEIFPLQMMVEEKISNLTMGNIAEIIRWERKIKSFRAINFPSSTKPIYVSSKDQTWVKEWAPRSFQEVINDAGIKVGGTFLYFLYGAWLSLHHEEVIGLLPRKQKPDVIGAFWAGEKFAGGKARVFSIGEFDLMTKRQWELYGADRKWRKVPAWVIQRLLENSLVLKEVKRRLITEKMYTPLVYDEEEDKFYFWKG